MIPLTRLRTESAIKSKYRGEAKLATDRSLMRAYRDSLIPPNPKLVFNSAFWKTAKTQLKRESRGKCAYCEANTDVVAHGDVEHFRPKSRYWWLAYTYDNYLYACQICNQTYKSDNFPPNPNPNSIPSPPILATTLDSEIDQLAGKISPDPFDVALIDFPLQMFVNQQLHEEAHLVNPYFDDPAIYFAYEADDVTEEVKVVPTEPKYQKNVVAAESFYGINRIELKNLRYSVYSKFKVFKMAHIALPDGPVKIAVKKQIDDMLSIRSLFTGMNRFFDTSL